MKSILRYQYFILTLLLFLNIVDINAQSVTKRAIVLINGKAHLVDMEDNGNIITIYQVLENYFTSSQSANALLNKANQSATKTGEGIVFFEREEEPQPTYIEQNSQPVVYGNEQYIGFSPERAILIKSAVQQIRNIADSFQEGQISHIKITSYHRDTYRSRSLARNRAFAIQDLLIAFGVPPEEIDATHDNIDSAGNQDYVRLAFVDNQ